MITDRPLTKSVTPTLGVPIIADIDAGFDDDIKIFYGLDQVAIRDSDYTQVIAGDFKSVTITPLAGLIAKAAGNQIIIAYEAPITQPWEIPPSPVLREGDLEGAFDRITLLARRISEKLGNALRLTNDQTAWDALTKRIVHVHDAVDPSDAVNLLQVQNLLASVASGDLPNLATLITYVGDIAGANVSAALNHVATLLTAMQAAIDAISGGATAGGLLTGALDYKSIIAVDSAATTDLGAVNGNRILLNGVADISSFGAGVEKFRITRHNGAHKLVAGANLVPPNAADIIAAVGDISAWISDAGAVWRCLYYTRATGRPVRAVLTDIEDISANARTMNAAANFAAIRTALGLGDLAPKNQTDLVYTGSSKTNTSFPIGTTVPADYPTGTAPDLNQAITIRLGGDKRYTAGPTGTALSGTWRASGCSDDVDNIYLFRRVA